MDSICGRKPSTVEYRSLPIRPSTGRPLRTSPSAWIRLSTDRFLDDTFGATVRVPIASDTAASDRFSDDSIGAGTVEHRSLLGRHSRRGYGRVPIASDTAAEYRPLLGRHRRRGYHRVSITSRTALSVRVTLEYRSLRIRQDGDHVCVPAISAPAGTSLAPAHKIAQGPRQSHSENQILGVGTRWHQTRHQHFCDSSWAAVLF